MKSSVKNEVNSADNFLEGKVDSMNRLQNFGKAVEYNCIDAMVISVIWRGGTQSLEDKREKRIDKR